MQRFSGGSLVSERLQSFIKPFKVIAGDFVWGFREFYLTQIDDIVASVDDHVNLFARVFCPAVPRTHIGKHSRDAEFLLYLWDMQKTHLLKGIAAPSPSCGVVKHVAPAVFVASFAVADESEIEVYIRVGYLEEGIAFHLAESVVFADDVAFAQVVENVG